MIGQTISHYRILAKIGEGGMGIVYKAEDTKLDRTVALKFLSSTAIASEEEKERFKREAKAAAALNHPNIGHIYAIEEAAPAPAEAGGQMFLAMEFIEGRSLEHLINSPLEGGAAPAAGGVTRPLPLDDAIDYATQIAAGLQAAHEKGITHRDIKSANIMVTDKGLPRGTGGVIKIMDFGLAKLANRSKMTQLGTTLGTAAYMSPEQARGEEADNRSDIWSLGVVLYEMISGQLPFKGDYEQAVIYSILHEDPEPLTALRSGLPIALDGIIAKALAKEPATRYQNVEELPADLQAIEQRASGASRLSLAGSTTTTQRMKLWFVIALTAIFSAFVVWYFKPQPSPTPLPTMYFTVPFPQAEQVFGELGGLGRHIVAISSDGAHIAFIANDHLYLRAMDQLEALPIPGTKGAREPFFSPDGKWLGFWARTGENALEGKLMKVRLSGGPAVTLCSALNPWGASWTQRGTILFGQGRDGIFRVPDTGGNPKVIVAMDTVKLEYGHGPQLLPGGKDVLFTLKSENAGRWDDANIVVQSLDTGTRRLLVAGGTDARYLPTGYLVYVQGGRLMAASFDATQLEMTGDAVPIADDILQAPSSSTGATQFSISPNGSLVYVPGRQSFDEERIIVSVNRRGTETILSKLRWAFWFPRISPDGRQIAFEREGQENTIWLYDLEHSQPIRLTNERASNRYPVWTPDGTRVVFASAKESGAPLDIYWKPADFSDAADLLLEGPFEQWPTSLSPDGRFLAFIEQHPETKNDIWLLNLDSGKAKLFLVTTHDESAAMFSPDGKWIAFVSNATGRQEVYVKSFPASDVVYPVSINGGVGPIWSPNGAELFYREDFKMMSATLENKSSRFRVVGIHRLFSGNYMYDRDFFDGEANYSYDATTNRFLMVKYRKIEERKPIQIVVVVNWFEELKRKVSGGKP